MKQLTIILVTWLIFSGAALVAQHDPFGPILEAMEQADARKVSGFFSSTVDLGFPDKDNTYSVSQGEMVLKDFFKNNPIRSFKLMQEGATDESSRYAICEYLSSEKQFRVYIHLRRDKDKYLIHKIKFEQTKSATTGKHED